MTADELFEQAYPLIGKAVRIHQRDGVVLQGSLATVGLGGSGLRLEPDNEPYAEIMCDVIDRVEAVPAP